MVKTFQSFTDFKSFYSASLDPLTSPSLSSSSSSSSSPSSLIGSPNEQSISFRTENKQEEEGNDEEFLAFVEDLMEKQKGERNKKCINKEEDVEESNTSEERGRMWETFWREK